MKKILYKLTKKYWSLLSLEHAKKNDFTVKNGLFKNLKINKDISWGKADIASKVYGLYENNIQKVLAKIKKTYTYRHWSCRWFFCNWLHIFRNFKTLLCF
jgi:hypothetical protein